ncbi:MAG: hypothetical protein GC164_02840 [Phycisphaera sp.]|nr:hypothetical protein [Phycisphaera sp.]
MRVLSKQVVIVVVAVISLTSAAWAGKPLKIFILAGQSNMQGAASISTFPAIGLDPKTAPMLKDMVTADGSPVECKDMDIVQFTGKPGDPSKEHHGKLTAGYGMNGGKIGPEFTFGIYMQKALNEPILIIKTAWGGKSLQGNFRPPSAGLLPDTASDAQKAEAGKYYELMMQCIKEVLADPGKYCPNYNKADGYELAGFVWFQGFNDYVGDYPRIDESKGKKSPKDYAEYTRLQACLIRDVRKALNAPKMPVVIGVFGLQGKDADERIVSFRKGQAATAEMPEFKGNVFNVFTENFWPANLAALKERYSDVMSGKLDRGPEVTKLVGEYRTLRKNFDKPTLGLSRKDAWHKRNALENQIADAIFTPEERKEFDGASSFDFHYWGSAKFYAQAGKAFAEALAAPVQNHAE